MFWSKRLSKKAVKMIKPINSVRGNLYHPVMPLSIPVTANNQAVLITIYLFSIFICVFWEPFDAFTILCEAYKIWIFEFREDFLAQITALPNYDNS